MASPTDGALRAMCGRARRRADAAGRIAAAIFVAAFRCFVVRDPALRRRAVRAAASTILRAFRIRTRRLGRPPVAGALVVANHVSYLDILVLLAVADARFVSKRQVASWPFVGGLARAAGTIFLDRASAAALPAVSAEIADAAGRGETVIVFPEGTTGEGGKTGRFRSSLLADAARRGVPVLPIALRYRCRPPHEVRTAVAWCGERTLLPHLLALADVADLRCDVVLGDVRRDRDRKRLASMLQADVDAMLADGRPSASVPTPAADRPVQRLSAALATTFNGRAAKRSIEPAT